MSGVVGTRRQLVDQQRAIARRRKTRRTVRPPPPALPATQRAISTASCATWRGHARRRDGHIQNVPLRCRFSISAIMHELRHRRRARRPPKSRSSKSMNASSTAVPRPMAVPGFRARDRGGFRSRDSDPCRRSRNPRSSAPPGSPDRPRLLQVLRSSAPSRTASAGRPALVRNVFSRMRCCVVCRTVRRRTHGRVSAAASRRCAPEHFRTRTLRR